jgi:hypothetical protein
MELRWYVDGHRRFLVLCALIPLLAGVVALGLQRDARPSWTTKVTIALPSAVASGNTATLTQWIASFQEALRSGGDSIPGLDGRLHASQQGKTGFVKVSYVGHKAAGGSVVLEQAVEAALHVVARPKQEALDTAQQHVTTAQAVVGQMQEVLDSFVAGARQPFPDQALASAQRSATELQVELAAADPAAAPALQRSLAAVNAQISELTPVAEQYQRLTLVLAQAQSELDSARHAQVGAQTALTDAETRAVIAGPVTTRQSKAKQVLRAVALWGGGGLALAFGLVVLSIVRSRPAPGEPR